MLSRSKTLTQAREAIAAVEQRAAAEPALQDGTNVSTGWSAVDAVLAGGGLRRDMLHEWFGDSRPGWQVSGLPLSVLVHMARQGLTAGEMRCGPSGWVVWIGRQVWPYPPAMCDGQSPDLVKRSLFVEARDAAERLWAADLATRSPATNVVVLDGHGLDMAATRRLQLATKAGTVLLLMARSGHEFSSPSVAGTRWRVMPTMSLTPRPRWKIELSRCKGAQRGSGMVADRTWLVEARGAKGLVVIPAGLADSTSAATVAAERGCYQASTNRHSA